MSLLYGENRNSIIFKLTPSALLFLYREVLRQELDGSINALRAKKSRRLPVFLTRTEAPRLITIM